MTGKWPYPLGKILMRSVVLPASLLAWSVVILMALLEKPNQSKARAYEPIANIILAGRQ